MIVRTVLAVFFLLTLSLGMAVANAQAPANSELVVDETFDSDKLGEKWHVNTGEWKVVNGVLRAKEVESEKHSAATRYSVETENAVYELRFRFVGEGKGFHFGFDPKPSTLNKRGHLFSVMFTPKSWKVMKHVDKDRPSDDPNETLAEQEMSFENDSWYKLRMTTWGNYVTATIDGHGTLKASHPTFGVPKPTLVIRCSGDGVEVDDIKVWRQIKQ